MLVKYIIFKNYLETHYSKVEKDISSTANAYLEIYENKPENYPMYIKGKYLNTAAKYAFVNEDFCFIFNP